MKKFSKILTLSILLASTIYASDKMVLEFEKKRVSQNPNIELKDVQINTKKEMPIASWTGYILDVKANVQGKEINVKDILFSNGEYIALDFIDPKSGDSLKDLLNPNLTSKYYDNSKLIAGNPNAKNKLVIFSDPLCPFCMDYVPDVIKFVKKNPENIALYYYHFPLTRIHPAALPLSKIIEVAKEKGIKDIELKTYEADWEKYFTTKTTDEKKILEAFNKEFKTDIKLEEINAPKIMEAIEASMKMGDDAMVQGTPTIFVNGAKDTTKEKYLTLGK